MRILISDDHAVLRDGLKPFVTQVAENVTILEADDYASTHACLSKSIQSNQAIDLVILDLRMPGMAGMDHMNAAAQLKLEYPQVPMVIMSGFMSHEEALRAMELKFLGYLPKSLSGTAMIHALRLVLCDVPFYPPEILLSSQPQADANLDAKLSLGASAMPRTETTSPDAVDAASLNVLTRREKEILTHLVKGASNRTIADSLGLTEITIKSHLRNIFRKIGANNRTQAVTFALNAGIQGAATP